MLEQLEAQVERTISLVSPEERKRNGVLKKFEEKMRRVLTRLKERAKEQELRALNSQGRPECIR